MQLVLILEADVLLRASMLRALAKLPSIDVVDACSLDDAVRLIEGLEVDLVLSDFELRDGTALQLLPHLSRGERRIPLVLISDLANEFAGSLPPDVEVRAKPLAPVDLRQLVTRTLGCADARSPFTLIDYIQIAAFGHRSVQVEISGDRGTVGVISIHNGQPWAASDVHGDGFEAVIRLMDEADPMLACMPLREPLPERTLTGSVEHVLMEATRLLDERRAEGAVVMPALEPSPPAAVPPPAVRSATLAPTALARTRRISVAPPIGKPVPRPTEMFAEGTRRTTLPPPPPSFESLYGEGIDALLAKRYRDAFDLLSRASALRTTPTLEANLHRLRAMGFS